MIIGKNSDYNLCLSIEERLRLPSTPVCEQIRHSASPIEWPYQVGTNIVEVNFQQNL